MKDAPKKETDGGVKEIQGCRFKTFPLFGNNEVTDIGMGDLRGVFADTVKEPLYIVDIGTAVDAVRLRSSTSICNNSKYSSYTLKSSFGK
jgi:hypothetical protein